MNTYNIYKKDKKTRNGIGVFLKIIIISVVIAILLLLVIATFPPLFRYKDFILEQTFTLNMVFIALIIISVLYYVFIRGKNSLLHIGKLYFEEENLFFGEKKINYDEIENIRIIGNDIYGEFRGQKSDGKGNVMIIKLKSGEIIECNFEQTVDNRLRDNDLLEKLYLRNIISKSNYHSIIKNTNYY